MNALRNYGTQVGGVNKNLEKLSTGYRVNRSADDAAGLAISEKMRAQITGMHTAQKNVKDGISLVKVGEGALTEIHSMLNRMYELAEQSANATYNEVDRNGLQQEVESLKKEIDRISTTANFNGQKLLNGELGFATVDMNFSGNTIGYRNVSYAKFSMTFESNAEEDLFTKALRDSSSSSFAISSQITSIGSNGNPAGTLNLGTPSFTPFSAQANPSSYQGTFPDSVSYTITHDNKVVGTLSVKLNTAPPQVLPTSTTANIKMIPGHRLNLQIGELAEDKNKLSLRIDSTKVANLGLDELDISDPDKALIGLEEIRSAIDFVSGTR